MSATPPPAPDAAVSPRGGRPSRAQAALVGERILEAATALFLTEGYGATSIELIARRARASKRTLYERFPGKPSLFGAVLQRLVERLRPPDAARLLEPGPLRPTLVRLAEAMLTAALTPEAVALSRMLLAEAHRFPELAATANRLGARDEAVDAIAALLQHAAPGGKPGSAGVARVRFAAEQFLQMVIALPQRRALGLGPPMGADQLRAWARDTVELFLDGYGAERPPVSAAKRR